MVEYYPCHAPAKLSEALLGMLKSFLDDGAHISASGLVAVIRVQSLGMRR
jgi:hypothetical protein